MQDVVGGGYGAIDVFGGVGRGDEGGLELRRGEENATVEHFAEETRVAFCIGAFRAGVIADGLVGEKYGAEGMAGIYLRRPASLGDGFAQTRDEPLRVLVDALVPAGCR